VTIGKAIREQRERKGLSQAELAERVGVSRVSVVAWEGDRATPSDERLAKLAEFFGVPVPSLRYPEDPGYALSREQLKGLDPLGDSLLLMPPAFYEIAYGLLAAMGQAGVSRAAVDKAEVLLTHLSHDTLTPGYSLDVSQLQAEARDAVQFLRRSYERRGVVIPESAARAVTEDPDAVSGSEFERQLGSGKRGKKAG